MRDPGGRLGPQISPDGEPDLRNFRVDCWMCDENDLIAIVSDGVHDNIGNVHIYNSYSDDPSLCR